ncbi:hypothetical protein BC834DRAFT_399744 [Gloeopeniophorella convolvens]|nr:hypothetical protein BC834DRAFT_399744 [Gloeopeniophorella convolvens]
MSPNIISWRASASDAYTSISSTSPVSSQSATPSVVSIDSIVPEREIMAWPNTRELQPVSESPVKLPPNTATLSEAKAPIGLRPVQDEEQPFMRHDTYYFEDGNITFLVRVTSHATFPSIDAHRTALDCRWTARCTACTDISSHAIRFTSPRGLLSSTSESMMRFLRSYPWVTSSVVISRHS